MYEHPERGVVGQSASFGNGAVKLHAGLEGWALMCEPKGALKWSCSHPNKRLSASLKIFPFLLLQPIRTIVPRRDWNDQKGTLGSSGPASRGRAGCVNSWREWIWNALGSLISSSWAFKSRVSGRVGYSKGLCLGIIPHLSLGSNGRCYLRKLAQFFRLNHL